MSWCKVNVVNLLQEFITDIFNRGLNCLNFDSHVAYIQVSEHKTFSRKIHTKYKMLCKSDFMKGHFFIIYLQMLKSVGKFIHIGGRRD